MCKIVLHSKCVGNSCISNTVLHTAQSHTRTPIPRLHTHTHRNLHTHIARTPQGSITRTPPLRSRAPLTRELYSTYNGTTLLLTPPLRCLPPMAVFFFLRCCCCCCCGGPIACGAAVASADALNSNVIVVFSAAGFGSGAGRPFTRI